MELRKFTTFTYTFQFPLFHLTNSPSVKIKISLSISNTVKFYLCIVKAKRSNNT